jgi:nucleoside-diphosphate-sugar epimerase
LILILGGKGYLGESLFLGSVPAPIMKVDQEFKSSQLTSSFLEEHKVTTIVNLANSPVDNDEVKYDSFDSNVVLPTRIVRACMAMRNKPRIIHFSSRETIGTTFQQSHVTLDPMRNVYVPHFLFNENVVPTPKKLFGVIKLAAERIILDYENATVVRLSTPYTPILHQKRGGLVSRIGHQARTTGMVKLGNSGRQMRDPLHIDDIGNFLSLVIDYSFPIREIFNIGGGFDNFFSLAEISRIINPNVEVQSEGNGDYGFCFDNTKAFAYFGWKPKKVFWETKWQVQ